MKTNLKRFALIACIIPFCSCGANLPLNSTDRESTLQPILNQTLTETSAYNVPPSQSKKGDRIFIIRSPFFLIMQVIKKAQGLSKEVHLTGTLASLIQMIS